MNLNLILRGINTAILGGMFWVLVLILTHMPITIGEMKTAKGAERKALLSRLPYIDLQEPISVTVQEPVSVTIER